MRGLPHETTLPVAKLKKQPMNEKTVLSIRFEESLIEHPFAQGVDLMNRKKVADLLTGYVNRDDAIGK